MMSAGVTMRPPRTRGGGRSASVEALDAAQPAAGRARHVPPSIVQGGRARFAQPHPQLDASPGLDDLQPVDLVGRRDDAFGEAEAEREILQILRRRHHHGVGAAVIGEGDGGLLRDHAFAVAPRR